MRNLGTAVPQPFLNLLCFTHLRETSPQRGLEIYKKFVFQQSVIFDLCVFILFTLASCISNENPVETFPPSCKQAVYLLSILNYSEGSFPEN